MHTPKKMGRPTVPNHKKLISKTLQFNKAQSDFINKQGGSTWLREFVDIQMALHGDNCHDYI